MALEVPVETSLRIDLPALPDADLSPNAFNSLGKWDQHKARASQRKTWLGLLRKALGPPPWPCFRGPVAITYTLRGVGRRGDSFNWGGHWGLKVLQDCLTAPKASPKATKNYGLGILPDDNWRWVPQVPRVLIEPEGKPQTTVEIVELEPIDKGEVRLG